jgi:2-amino-4-hydroxy-6-hydroxymethyldihydropteridine diphosphokinase
MSCCYIALGGNVGDVDETFRWAVARLGRDGPVNVTRFSSVFRTRPVGPNAGGEFTNAAAEVETDLEPLVLLDLLQDLERRAGRTHGEHWGPRPLDLDLILYADQIIDVPRLRVPHPACWYRRFVLDPLAEIASDVRHPVKRLTVGELRSRLLLRPLVLALAGSSHAQRQSLRNELLSTTSGLEIFDWRIDAALESEPTLIAWLGPHDPPSFDGPVVDFQSLPLVPRLDASTATGRAAFLRGILEAALG